MNTHIEHLEELVWMDRPKLRSILENPVKISHKIDGAPAVIVGPGFVSTKSYFNKEPKIYSKAEDFDQIKNPQVRKKLKVLWENLPQDLDGTYMGDFLYSKEDLLEDSETVSFSPNLISYTAEKESEAYSKIQESNLGVVFHCKVSEEGLQYGVIPNINAPELFTFDPRIDHTFPNDCPMQDLNLLYIIGRKYKQSQLNSIGRSALKYFNAKIRKGEHNTSPTDFMRWLRENDPKKVQLFSKLRHYIFNAFETYKRVETLKYERIDALKQYSIPLTASYSGEGYVLSYQNKATKLVDRYSFSSYNFNNSKFIPTDCLFCFGRFNPPTKAHSKLFKMLEAENGVLFTSQSHDYEKNPLKYDEKIALIKKIAPDLEIISDESISTVYDAANSLYEKGFEKPKLLVGDDRARDFKDLGVPLQIVPRDDVSATKMRNAARSNDFASFRKYAPDLEPRELSKLFSRLK